MLTDLNKTPHNIQGKKRSDIFLEHVVFILEHVVFILERQNVTICCLNASQNLQMKASSCDGSLSWHYKICHKRKRHQVVDENEWLKKQRTLAVISS